LGCDFKSGVFDLLLAHDCSSSAATRPAGSFSCPELAFGLATSP
jgi:hypothetical protein